MISPFMKLGEAIAVLNKIIPDFKSLISENPDLEMPEWVHKMCQEKNLELARVFLDHDIDSAAGLYAEIICGATPSKGCAACGFIYAINNGEPRCQFTGSCTPINNPGNDT